MWDDFETKATPPIGWALLTETGWDALKLGSLRSLRACRCPKDPNQVSQWALDAAHSPDRRRAASQLLTKEDQDSVDQDLNTYIGEAGLDPRPSGFHWFLQLPDRFATGADLDGYLNVQLSQMDPQPRLPSEVFQQLNRVLRPLYG